MFDVNELKVGDEVGYSHSHSGTLMSHGFSTVAKVGKNSITLADGKKFSMRGWKWGGTPYYCERLVDASELRKRVASANRSNEIGAAIFEAKKKIEEILRGHRNGHSGENTPITTAERDEMLALINAIPVEGDP